jgi:hypothetical protein
VRTGLYELGDESPSFELKFLKTIQRMLQPKIAVYVVFYCGLFLKLLILIITQSDKCTPKCGFACFLPGGEG